MEQKLPDPLLVVRYAFYLYPSNAVVTEAPTSYDEFMYAARAYSLDKNQDIVIPFHRLPDGTMTRLSEALGGRSTRYLYIIDPKTWEITESKKMA